MSEEEEFIINDSDEVDDEIEAMFNSDDGHQEDNIFQDDSVDPRFSSLQNIVNTYCAYMYESPASLSQDGTIDVDIPRTFLPLSLQAVYGFFVNDIVLHLSFKLSDYNWRKSPSSISVLHPVLGKCYVGNALVKMVITDFFSDNYKPRPSYRSAPYFICSSGKVDLNQMKELEKLGFSSAQSQRTLLLFSNNMEKTIAFLRTGELPFDFKVDLANCPSYRDCPLMYLILEIADAFLDLQDHCNICRCPTTPGLKPSVCNKELCNFRFCEIGIGTSVIQEIKRDPMVADLTFSVFSSAIRTHYLTPSPPGFNEAAMEKICKNMPPMQQMAQSCQNDKELTHQIGAEAVSLLRWVLLSNRSHLIYLPPELQLPEFQPSKQFLALISSPEAESTFQYLKDKYGSIYLWHGSHGERWHSIIRNGLKNGTGTKLQQNGAVLGEGIYFARSSGTSWGYSKLSDNKYKSSVMGKQLHIISLVEIANLPIGKEVTIDVPCHTPDKKVRMKKVSGVLKDHQWAHTLTLEEACVVRFVMVGGDFNVDVLKNPPKKVPTLKDVLNYHASHGA